MLLEGYLDRWSLEAQLKDGMERYFDGTLVWLRVVGHRKDVFYSVKHKLSGKIGRMLFAWTPRYRERPEEFQTPLSGL